jgi:hypothetical protein
MLSSFVRSPVHLGTLQPAFTLRMQSIDFLLQSNLESQSLIR